MFYVVQPCCIFKKTLYGQIDQRMLYILVVSLSKTTRNSGVLSWVILVIVHGQSNNFQPKKTLERMNLRKFSLQIDSFHNLNTLQMISQIFSHTNYGLYRNNTVFRIKLLSHIMYYIYIYIYWVSCQGFLAAARALVLDSIGHPF